MSSERDKHWNNLSAGKQQAFALFPTAYITQISILQAIALESVIGAGSRVIFDSGNTLHFQFWLELSFLLHVVVAIWMHYVVMCIPMRWKINLPDFTMPFGIAFCEFVAIAWLGRGTLIPLFGAIFLGFGVGVWHVSDNVRRAKEEIINGSLASSFPLNRIRRTYALLSVVGLAGLIGILLGAPAPAHLNSALLIAGHVVLLWSSYEWLRWWKKASN